jgi:ABC-type phosphate/phosphonate transport system permease subunit
MENQRLNIGIIGAGMIGKVHAENLSLFDWSSSRRQIDIVFQHKISDG